MPIPRINNGDTLKDIRELSLNPMINVVNEHETELGEKSILIAQNAAATLVNKDAIATNTAAIHTLTQEIVDVGGKCVVDHRVFDYNTTGSYAAIAVDLEAKEFPVRAVTRSFTSSTKKGSFVPCAKVDFDRATNTLTADVGSVKSGQLFIEFWKFI